MFQTLHLMFEQQYNELARAVDLIASASARSVFPLIEKVKTSRAPTS